MDRMEMDCNLKQLAIFFQVHLVYCRDVAKNLITARPSLLKSVNIFFLALKQQFHFIKKVICQIFEQFWPKYSKLKSPRHCPFKVIITTSKTVYVILINDSSSLWLL